MQNKLNISLKPWENVRSAEGKHGAAHKFIRLNSSTHLPKNTLSSVADSLVVNGSDGELFVYTCYLFLCDMATEVSFFYSRLCFLYAVCCWVFLCGLCLLH